MLFDVEKLAARSAELESASPTEILTHAIRDYSPRIAISTAFGVEGCALIHMALTVDPQVKVFTVDTGYLFAETRELMRRFVDELGVNLTVFEPQLSVPEQERRYGIKLYKTDPDSCCAIRKVEPTRRALAGLDCWIAGLRRDQAQTRAGIQVLERLDDEDGRPIVKVHPLAGWTRDDVWRYVLANDVPYNALLDEGYKSIGCWPCTRPVAAGEGERAGRWNGDKTECGIHTMLPRRPARRTTVSPPLGKPGVVS
jgi:phosphoadenosine phosphosulfate reductase